MNPKLQKDNLPDLIFIFHPMYITANGQVCHAAVPGHDVANFVKDTLPRLLISDDRLETLPNDEMFLETRRVMERCEFGKERWAQNDSFLIS